MQGRIGEEDPLRAPTEGLCTPARCILERAKHPANGNVDQKPYVAYRSEWPGGKPASPPG